MNYLGIDKYINNVAFSYIRFNNLDDMYDHMTEIIRLKSIFYGKLQHNHLDNGEFLEEYKDGTICNDHPTLYNATRNTTIIYSCDREMATSFEILNVKEHSICQYEAKVKSKYLCAPEYTKGYVDNDIQCNEI